MGIVVTAHDVLMHVIVAWSIPPMLVPDFTHIAWPLIRRTFPSSITMSKFVDVDPMPE